MLRFLLIAFCFVSSVAFAGDAQTIAQGRYLAVEGDCVVCHTGRAPGNAPFAGGYPLHAAPGTVYSSNITPDKDTGIGKWTADEFYRAMHDGIAADGHHLYPAFPYVYFAKLSRTDTDALFAYLGSVKPVHYRPPDNDLIFPMNIRAMMVFWNALYLHTHSYQRNPSRPQAWNRGAELVQGIGHCAACHAPKNLLFADTGDVMSGNLADGWYAPNLTSASPDGLGGWSAQDIAQYLKTGTNRFTHVTGAMRDVVEKSTSQMSDADRLAIAIYLKSLPAASSPAVAKPKMEVMRNGQAVFVARCAVCHMSRGGGNADYPNLAGNTIVQARNPDTVLRVILQGSQSVHTVHGDIGYSMPAFPVLSDRDLADLATYVRNAWGNRADPVREKAVKDFRKLLK